MNIRPIHSNMDRTNFGAFIPKSPDYLRNKLSSQDINDLNKAAENIQNTNYFDLEARDNGFVIVNKETKDEYMGDLQLKTYGMWGEGGTWLVDEDNIHRKTRKRVNLTNYLTNEDWNEIHTKYQNKKQVEMSIGERYVYYTDLLDRYEQRRREKIVAENAGRQESMSQIDNEETLKEKAIKQLMEKYKK